VPPSTASMRRLPLPSLPQRWNVGMLRARVAGESTPQVLTSSRRYTSKRSLRRCRSLPKPHQTLPQLHDRMFCQAISQPRSDT
jgi:hypothetical protein